MKVVILAGGLGSRLQEETVMKPKPMVEIGGKPILWHIMKNFSCQGFNEFIIALGYKGEVIKDYFQNYVQRNHDLTINLKTREVIVHDGCCEEWLIHLVDTGSNTQTGGRIKRLAPWIGNEPFMLTYGDGVANINLNELLQFHKASGKLATVTAVRPSSRFGGLDILDNTVVNFIEKPQIGEGWINGGFFILQPEVFDLISGDDIVWEQGPMESLAKSGLLAAYTHRDFWQCMDTIREKQTLEKMWSEGNAAWKIWE